MAPLRDGKPNSGHYGFGWFIEQQNGHRDIEHGGAWQGFETHISRYVDDGLTVVVLTNLEGAIRAGSPTASPISILKRRVPRLRARHRQPAPH